MCSLTTMGSICGKSRTRVRVTDAHIQREAEEHALALNDIMGPGLHGAIPSPGQELTMIEARRSEGLLSPDVRLIEDRRDSIGRSWMLGMGLDPDKYAQTRGEPKEVTGFTAYGSAINEDLFRQQMSSGLKQFQSIDSLSSLPTLTEEQALESLMCSRTFRSHAPENCLDGIDPPGYKPPALEEAPPIDLRARGEQG